MADALGDVDTAGVSSHHDVEMQRRSGRSSYLIARTWGIGAPLTCRGPPLIEAVLEPVVAGGPEARRLLHLSQQCNRPDLALRAARSAIRGRGRRTRVHAGGAGDRVAQPARPSPSRTGPAGRLRGRAGELPF